MLEKLGEHACQFGDKRPEARKFRTIVLLDDFSASGSSYYALTPKADGSFGGKIAKFQN